MSTNTTQETEAVIKQYAQSIPHGPDSVVGNYAEDAIFLNQAGIYHGHTEIRQAWDVILHAPDGLLETIQITKLSVDGEYGFMVSKSKEFLFMITDTFVVRNGKIVMHTVFIPEEFGSA